MGYWGVSASSSSLFTALHENTELLWGDAPADCLDAGLDRLIARLRGELGRFPTVAEVDALKATAPEMAEAIAKAKKVFAEDVERDMLDVELEAGLRFADTEIALDSAMRRDVVVGDLIRWGLWEDRGFYREITTIAEAAVLEIVERELISKWTGKPYLKVMYVVEHDGARIDVGPEWATKVLPGDEPIDEVNARRVALSDN